MKKFYSIIAFIALATTLNVYTMDPERNPMFKLIDQFIGSDALGTPTNWDAVFALLKTLAKEGNAFTANEYSSQDGLTLLSKAAEDNDVLAAKKLLGLWNAKPNAAMIRNGMTPLMIACFNGNIEMARLLIEYGANPYIKNNEGHDSFYFAERYYQMNSNIRNRNLLNILRAYSQ